jgi:peptidoglycan/xylan/chitin deacetylase (PgdA/CDA1 family)
MPSRTGSNRFWPDDIRLVISISMQFEAGGQPAKGTDSPFPKVAFPDCVPSDLAANTWFAYGYREGIPRMLDLWDRHAAVKVTSHMIGEAAERHPELAREIVERGHEAAGHGPRWSSQHALSRKDERNFIVAGTEMVEAATGHRPIGYNCNWLRRGPNSSPTRCGTTIFCWSRAAITRPPSSSTRSKWTSTSFMRKPATGAA